MIIIRIIGLIAALAMFAFGLLLADVAIEPVGRAMSVVALLLSIGMIMAVCRKPQPW